jgi:hypothetical protein
MFSKAGVYLQSKVKPKDIASPCGLLSSLCSDGQSLNVFISLHDDGQSGGDRKDSIYADFGGINALATAQSFLKRFRDCRVLHNTNK